jgi:hypothetical protein
VQDPGSAQYESVFTQLRASAFIIRAVVSVLSAIRRDYQTVLMTAEIGDEASGCAGALTAIAKVVTAQVKP